MNNNRVNIIHSSKMVGSEFQMLRFGNRILNVMYFDNEAWNIQPHELLVEIQRSLRTIDLNEGD